MYGVAVQCIVSVVYGIGACCHSDVCCTCSASVVLSPLGSMHEKKQVLL